VNVETQILRLEHEIDPNYPFETGGDLPRNARLRSLTVLLLAYSVGASSELGNAAKFDMYEEALYDLPVWVCNAAIRKWNRGEAGIAGANCQFPPAPGVLRQIADNEIKVYIVRIAGLKRLMNAMSIDEAMDPRRIPIRGL
jgi:hypothetical protein